MRAPRDDTMPIRATPAHILIALAVILIFFAPFVLKFFFPDTGLAKWVATGMRVVWFYLLSYSGVVGILYWVDNKRHGAKISNDS
jgi:Na+-driven multidrug efflux pump